MDRGRQHRRLLSQLPAQDGAVCTSTRASGSKVSIGEGAGSGTASFRPNARLMEDQTFLVQEIVEVVVVIYTVLEVVYDQLSLVQRGRNGGDRRPSIGAETIKN